MTWIFAAFLGGLFGALVCWGTLRLKQRAIQPMIAEVLRTAERVASAESAGEVAARLGDGLKPLALGLRAEQLLAEEPELAAADWRLRAVLLHVRAIARNRLEALDNQSMDRQLARGQRLAVIGEVVSGLADELRGPIGSMTALARNLLAADLEPGPERIIQTVLFEAQRAAGIVENVVAINGCASGAKPEPVDVNAMLAELAAACQTPAEERGIQIRTLLAEEFAETFAAPDQLRRVFSGLLNHAVGCQESVAGERLIAVSSSADSRRVLVAIGYSHGPDGREAPEALLGAARGVVQALGGELRALNGSARYARFEIDLPLRERIAALPEPGSSKILTTLVVEPDGEVRKHIVERLSAHGHRAIPVESAEEGLSLASKMRFDIVLCAVKLPRTSWVELHRKVRRSAAFVLLTDGFDADLARTLRDAEGYTLSKPVVAEELAGLLSQIDAKPESRLARTATA